MDPERVQRQIIMPELGIAGQKRLDEARVLVVGCGGLGAALVQYLAASGIGNLTLLDDDVVEPSNLNRQVLFSAADIGRPKAQCAGRWVNAFAPECAVTAQVARFGIENAAAWCGQHDVIVDGTDGLPVKYLLNDCAVVHRVPLVHGAVTALSGQVMVIPAGGAPCLRCVFPQIASPDDVPSCQQAGIIGAAAGLIGSIMALEVLKLLGLDAPPLRGRFLTLDAKSMRQQIFDVPVDNTCAVCGDTPTIFANNDADYITAATI